MEQPLLIIVTGAPCTGKTQIAKWLSQELSLPFINKDGIKELLFDRLGWSDREWSRILSLTSYDLLYYFLEVQLRATKHVLVEANFKQPVDSLKMMHLVIEYHYQPVQFHCYTDKQVLLERFQNRASWPDRHPGHVDHLTLEDLQASLESDDYQALALPGRLIEVDTTDFSQVDYQLLSNEIRLLTGHP